MNQTQPDLRVVDDPVPGLPGDEAGARVVREELRLFVTVQRALAAATNAGAGISHRETDDARLLELLPPKKRDTFLKTLASLAASADAPAAPAKKAKAAGTKAAKASAGKKKAKKAKKQAKVAA